MRRLLVVIISLGALAVAAAAWGSGGHASAATKVVAARRSTAATFKALPPFGRLVPFKIIAPRLRAIQPFRGLVPGPTCYVGASACSLQPCVEFVSPGNRIQVAPAPLAGALEQRLRVLHGSVLNTQCKRLARAPVAVSAVRITGSVSRTAVLDQYAQPVARH